MWSLRILWFTNTMLPAMEARTRCRTGGSGHGRSLLAGALAAYRAILDER